MGGLCCFCCCCWWWLWWWWWKRKNVEEGKKLWWENNNCDKVEVSLNFNYVVEIVGNMCMRFFLRVRVGLFIEVGKGMLI